MNVKMQILILETDAQTSAKLKKDGYAKVCLLFVKKFVGIVSKLEKNNAMMVTKMQKMLVPTLAKSIVSLLNSKQLRQLTLLRKLLQQFKE